MSRWEPTIDTRRQQPRAAPSSDVDRALARLEARAQALEQRTKRQRYSEMSADDRAAFDHITRERSRLRSRQYKHNRRREWRAARDKSRTGHRRELGRTREKGPDMTERIHACLQEVGLYRCVSHRHLLSTPTLTATASQPPKASNA